MWVWPKGAAAETTHKKLRLTLKHGSSDGTVPVQCM